MIEELAAETGLTVAIALWGNRGAPTDRVASAATPLHVSVRTAPW